MGFSTEFPVSLAPPNKSPNGSATGGPAGLDLFPPASAFKLLCEPGREFSRGEPELDPCGKSNGLERPCTEATPGDEMEEGDLASGTGAAAAAAAAAAAVEEPSDENQSSVCGAVVAGEIGVIGVAVAGDNKSKFEPPEEFFGARGRDSVVTAAFMPSKSMVYSVVATAGPTGTSGGFWPPNPSRSSSGECKSSPELGCSPSSRLEEMEGGRGGRVGAVSARVCTWGERGGRGGRVGRGDGSSPLEWDDDVLVGSERSDVEDCWLTLRGCSWLMTSEYGVAEEGSLE